MEQRLREEYAAAAKEAEAKWAAQSEERQAELQAKFQVQVQEAQAQCKSQVDAAATQLRAAEEELRRLHQALAEAREVAPALVQELRGRLAAAEAQAQEAAGGALKASLALQPLERSLNEERKARLEVLFPLPAPPTVTVCAAPAAACAALPCFRHCMCANTYPVHGVQATSKADALTISLQTLQAEASQGYQLRDQWQDRCQAELASLTSKLQEVPQISPPA